MTHHISWDQALKFEECPSVVNYLVLPRSLFPNGTAYYNVKLSQRLGVVPYIVHNNCIIGHDSKVDRFKMYGQWYIPTRDDVDFKEATQGAEPKRHTPLFSLRPHREVVTCLSIHPNKKTLYTSAYDKTVKAYNMDHINKEASSRLSASQSSGSDAEVSTTRTATIAPSGGGLLNRRGGVWCMAWSTETSSSSTTNSTSTASTSLSSVASHFPSSSSGFHAASTAQQSSDSTAASVLALLSQLAPTILDAPASASSFITQQQPVVSSTSPTCYTGGHDRHVLVWQTNEGLDEQVFANQGPWTLLHTMKGHQSIVNDVIFHRGQVFSASDDGTVRSWDPTKGQRTRIFRAGSGWMSSITADGPALFATSSDGSAYAWEIATARIMQVYIGHTGWVRSVVVSGHNKRVYTAGSDGTIREWDMISGDSSSPPRRLLPHHLLPQLLPTRCYTLLPMMD